MLKIQSLAFLLLLAGCAANEVKEISLLSEKCDRPNASIEFIARTDMRRRDVDAQDVRWGIAVSKADITTVVKDGWSYNEPVLNVRDNDKYIVARDIRSFEKKTIHLKPDVYDWLILLDLNNNGSWDSYLGSVEEHIKLNRNNFKENHIYSVVVGADSTPRLQVRLNKSKHSSAENYAGVRSTAQGSKIIREKIIRDSH